MHLLWLKLELLHPVDKGGRIRTYQMLRALRRHHRITYVALDDGRAAPDAVALGQEYAHEVITVPFHPPKPGTARYFLDVAANLVSGLPYAIARYRSPALARRVEALVNGGGVDVLVSDFLVSAVNVPPELRCATLLFQHNVEAVIWRRRGAVARHAIGRAFFGYQYRRMVEFERSACRRFDRVVAVSADDAAHFRTAYGLPAVDAVSTGVDTEYFTPDSGTARDPKSLVFVGSMDWAPNGDAIRFFLAEVWPAVRRRIPEATLAIVGRNPGSGLRALAERVPGVTVTGTVPDVRPFLAGAGAMVVPLRVGGGTRLKIFEAMAMETPVVSTTIGAEGLPVRHGEHLLIADSASGLADACIGALTRREETNAMAHRAAILVRERFGWEAVAGEFAAACERARADHSRTTNSRETTS